MYCAANILMGNGGKNVDNFLHFYLHLPEILLTHTKFHEFFCCRYNGQNIYGGLGQR